MEGLLNLLIPSNCLICQTPLVKGEKGLCLCCQSKLPRARCEMPDNEAEHRVFGRINYEHGTAFCYYAKGGEFASLISRAKFHDKPWINRHLTELFVAELSGTDWPYDIDIIVPVPISFLRKITRGYNQVLPIAKTLSEKWHLPIDRKSLKKKFYSRSQLSRTGENRLTGVAGTFRLSHPERFSDKHVLLVDDVMTTGATLEACAQLFTDAGARVSFLTLALAK